MRNKINDYIAAILTAIPIVAISLSIMFLKTFHENDKILSLVILDTGLITFFIISIIYTVSRSKSRIYDELKESEVLQEIYAKILEKFNEAKTQQDLFKGTLDILIDYRIAYGGAGYILDKSGNVLNVVYKSFNFKSNLENNTIKVDNFLGKPCIDYKKSYYLKIEPQHLKIESSLTKGTPSTNLYYFPILFKKKIIGVLEILTEREINPKSENTLSKIIYHLGIGLNQIELNSKVRKLYKDLEKKNSLLEAQYRELQAQSEELEAQTEELRAQKAELENYSKKLHQAQKYKSDFIANMSHELRTPLNSIIGLTEILLSDKEIAKNPDLKEKLNIINLSGRQLLNIINDILDLTKIESGKMEVNIEEFNIKEVIEYVTTIIKPQCDDKNLYLKIVENIKDGKMKTDKYKLNQILLNILSNAVKYTKKGGIILTVEESENLIKISVKDTGIGIPDEIKDKIFEPFISMSYKIHIQGTGIGLPLTKRLINLIGGNISMTSKVGEGSEFIVTIPKFLNNTEIEKEEKEKETVEIPTKAEDTNEKSKKINIVVADDDPLYLKEITYLVKDIFPNVNVITASDGEEAKRILESTNNINLIMLDLDMPKISGYEILDFIKRRKLKTKAIIVTALDIDKKTMSSYSEIVEGLFIKGKDNPSYLKSIVNQALSHTTLEKEKQEDKVIQKEIKDTYRILLVEDNFTNRYVIKEMLKKYNVEIDEAENGKKALEKLKNNEYSLVLLDIQMPIMNGYETFEKIRKELKLTLPVIALTAKALKDEIDEFRQKGFDDVITKPIVLQRFIDTVGKFIDLKKIN